MPIFNNSIDKIVKEEFLTIYNNATDEANKTFNEYLSSIQRLSYYNQIKSLNELEEEIEKEEKKVNVLAYLENAESKSWLLKLYSSRSSILNVNDSEELHQPVYLRKLKNKISNYLLDLKNEIPPFSYDNFLKGKFDPIFFDLDYYEHIGETDFKKIRSWQQDKIIEIVSFETSKVVNKIQNKIKNTSNELFEIEKDLSHFENNISNNSFNSVEDLIRQLSQLSFMSDYDFDNINFSQGIEDYTKFVSTYSPWPLITPEYSECLIEKLNSSNEEPPFTVSPIIFYTIHQTISWMKTALKNKSSQDNFTYPDYRTIAKEVLEEARNESGKLIEDFINETNISALTEEKSKAKYIDILDDLRHEFNNSDEILKVYFASLQRQDNIKRFFELNTLFSDLDYERKYLKKAYILREQIHYFLDCYRQSSDKDKVEYSSFNEGSGAIEAVYLMYNMVLDNDLYEELSRIHDEFMLNTLKYCLPNDIAQQIFRLDIQNIFHKCLDRLIDYLNDTDAVDNKVIYIQTRLKQIKQRELGSKRIEMQYNEKVNHHYTSLLRECLELETEYIYKTKDISFKKPAKRTKVTKRSSSKRKNLNQDSNNTIGFGFRSSDKTALKSFITDLNGRIGLLRDDDENAVDDFFSILTAKSFTEELTVVSFDCETTQLYYIFNKLKPYFKKLTFANIERSQLFKTQSGILLKAQNLSSSKVEYPKEYKEINKAFTLLQ